MLVLSYLYKSSYLSLIILLSTAGVALTEATPACARIISLAPSTTELLYYVGLGQNVIAVSSYDRYPAEVIDKPRIGGLLDSNLEGILRLKPSLVVLLTEHRQLSEQLKELKLPILKVDHMSVNGIIASVKMLGDYCQLNDANEKKKKLSDQVEYWQGQVKSKIKPNVLLVVGSANQSGQGQTLYISGRDGFYASLLEIIGARQIFSGATQSLNELSLEGLLALKADIIIAILPNDEGAKIESADVFTHIKNILPDLAAVKNKRLYSFNADYMYIPGPRFTKALEKLYEVVHE